MQSRKPEDNLWLSIFQWIIGFLMSFYESFVLVFESITGRSKKKILTHNHFLASFHYFIHDFPKEFWKKPTGIGAGRGIGQFFLFFFAKKKYFEQKKEAREHAPQVTAPVLHASKERATSGNPTADSANQARLWKKGFTLIEMILALTLVSGLLVLAFGAFGNVAKVRNRVIGEVDIYEQLYSSIEQFAENIKQSGGIDYEEYFNREMVGKTMTGGHYLYQTGFWNYGGAGSTGTANFGSGAYQCRSSTSLAMTASGCATIAGLNTAGVVHSGTPGIMQRYGEYRLQFIDYNGNGSDDTAYCAAAPRSKPGIELGDQNCDGSIIGDDDDEDLGKWPVAYSGSGVPELYLIKKWTSNPERRLFRLKIERDPDAPASAACDTASGTVSGCIGTLQMLRLIGRDLWDRHGVSPATPVYDGQIDTWECPSDYNCTVPGSWAQRRLPTGNDSEWVPLFSGDINVLSLQFFPSPNNDSSLAWKDPGNLVQNPNVRVSITLGYSWKRRKVLNLENPQVTVTTTLNLTKE